MWILQEPYSSGVLVKNEYPVYRVCKWDIYIYIYISHLYPVKNLMFFAQNPTTIQRLEIQNIQA